MSRSLERQLENIHKREQQIELKIKERNKKRTIPCASCNEAHQIGNLEAIQTHFYVEPHGCTEGDYWLPGEIEFVCPTTQVINRLLFNNNDVPYNEREKFENNPEMQFRLIYGPLFKDIKDAHDKHPYPDSKKVNNFHVDTHREEYGLVKRRVST